MTHLHFSLPVLPQATPAYVLTGEDPYKSALLNEWNQKLRAMPEHWSENELKLLTIQMYAENGIMNADRTDGVDKGCSLGLFQYNTCANVGISAKAFLKKHPDWMSPEVQMQWMMAQLDYRFSLYGHNIYRILEHHNSPLAARTHANCQSYPYVARIILLTRRLQPATL